MKNFNEIIDEETGAKARKAIRKFLTAHSYEILEEPTEGVFSFVCKDEECLVFCSCLIGEGQFDEPNLTRSDAEKDALPWLFQHGIESYVRFDLISLMTMDGMKTALVRHHINALGEVEGGR